jgi:hypothetical protein
MSNQAGWFTGAVEQVKADAASRIEVGWDWALPGGASHAVRARRTRGIALAVVLVCLLALPPLTPAEAIPPPAPAIAPDAPGDEYWAEGFNSLGMSDTVSAMAFGPDGSLYAGGEFTTAGSVIARYIARWDGAQWYPLGSGMGGSDPYPFVYDLAFGPDGSLYAGGDFTTAGGVAANHIARWDGATSSWHPLGSGMNNHVWTLAVGHDGSLYAGGSFTTAGGVAADHIARWDGATSSWHPLGSGVFGYSMPAVNALAFGPDGSLYVGGSFTEAGGKPSSYIALWLGEVTMPPVLWFPLVRIHQ